LPKQSGEIVAMADARGPRHRARLPRLTRLVELPQGVPALDGQVTGCVSRAGPLRL